MISVRQMNTYKMNCVNIKEVFDEQNQYLFWVVNKIFSEIKRSSHRQPQEQHKQQLPTKSSHEEVLNS